MRAPFGISPVKLRRRPYLHISLGDWERLCGAQANRPTAEFQRCRHDLRPGPDRLPRADMVLLETAAFVAAVLGSSADRQFLSTHLDLLLPSHGMDVLGVRRGAFLAAAAFAYDVLPGAVDEPAYAALRRTLIDHAERTTNAAERHLRDAWALESPALVATLAGLNLAGLALLGEEEAAARWVEFSDERLEKVFELVATDGWWPTGFDDWNRLLPLLVRVADAWERLAGRDRFEHGVFQEAWRVALHGLTPEGHESWCFDQPELEHGAAPGGSAREAWRLEPCWWALARLQQRFGQPGLRAVVERWRRYGLERPSPWTLLWGLGTSARSSVAGPPHHVFAARGLALWRSGWDPGALAVGFAPGPASGDEARQRAAHWRPAVPLAVDANHLLAWAAGRPWVVRGPAEAGSAGFNTILVDGRGPQPVPCGEGRPGLTEVWLSEGGGSMVGRVGGCYAAELGVTTFDRHLALAPGYLLVWDHVAADRPRAFEWVLHLQGHLALGDPPTMVEVGQDGGRLEIRVLRPDRVEVAVREGGSRAEEPRGTLVVANGDPVEETQFLVLLAPDSPTRPAPLHAVLVTGEGAVGARLVWPDGDREEVLFPTRERGITLEHLRCDAACLALRRTAEGEWRRLLARRVAKVLVPGGAVLRATQPVHAALEAGATQVEGQLHSPTGATVTIRCPFLPRGVLVDGVSGPARTERGSREVKVRLTAGLHHLRVTGR